MDIKVDHVSKAYGEQQILRDLCCVFQMCIRDRLYQRVEKSFFDSIADVIRYTVILEPKEYVEQIRSVTCLLYTSFRLSLGMCWKSGVFRYIFALYSFSPIEPEGTPITSAATPAFQHIPSESLHAERK